MIPYTVYQNQRIDLTGSAYTHARFLNCTVVGEGGYLKDCYFHGGTFAAVKVRAWECEFAPDRWRRDNPAPMFLEAYMCSPVGGTA